MREELGDAIRKIWDQYRRIDRCFSFAGADESEKKECAAWVESEQLVPRCSHAFTKYLGPCFGSSFRVNRMVDQPLMVKVVGGKNRINRKDGAKEFAERLGVAVPFTLDSGVPWSDIAEDYGCDVVVKPTAGTQSVGVYGLVRGGLGIVDCFSGARYGSMREFKLVNAQDSVEGQWEVEELVGVRSEESAFSPGVDVKFYTFYGEVVLVLQVDRWCSGGKKYCWFDPNGEAVSTGKYKNAVGGQVGEPRFSGSDLDRVAKMSRELPTPFCRIDFLVGASGLVFGELTFNSGAPGAFSSVWDRRCGKAFLRAKERLMRDLLDGKRFSHYREVNGR